mmetsp:Transcript_705/g.2107  ORF Transcript_705/g.2107 Transcript_705/m.2107 type:complete len:222 (+) Transcript_705:783-1448(+)
MGCRLLRAGGRDGADEGLGAAALLLAQVCQRGREGERHLVPLATAPDIGFVGRVVAGVVDGRRARGERAQAAAGERARDGVESAPGQLALLHPGDELVGRQVVRVVQEAVEGRSEGGVLGADGRSALRVGAAGRWWRLQRHFGPGALEAGDWLGRDGLVTEQGDVRLSGQVDDCVHLLLERLARVAVVRVLHPADRVQVAKAGADVLSVHRVLGHAVGAPR